MSDAQPLPTTAPTCVKCGYSLEGLASPDRTCPECGSKNAHAGVRRCPGCYALLPQPAPLRCPECESPTEPPPRNCVRCRYDLAGIVDPRRVCPECGLDNSPIHIEVMARRMRRESVWLRVTLWAGVVGAFACFAGAKRLGEHWQYYAGTRSKLPRWLDDALLTLMVVCIATSMVAFARWMTIRSRVVEGRANRSEWLLGTLIGLAVGSAGIVLIKVLGFL